MHEVTFIDEPYVLSADDFKNSTDKNTCAYLIDGKVYAFTHGAQGDLYMHSRALRPNTVTYSHKNSEVDVRKW